MRGRIYSIYYPQGKYTGMRLTLCLGVRQGMVTLYIPAALYAFKFSVQAWNELIVVKRVVGDHTLCYSMQYIAKIYRRSRVRFSEAHYHRALKVLGCTWDTESG